MWLNSFYKREVSSKLTGHPKQKKYMKKTEFFRRKHFRAHRKVFSLKVDNKIVEDMLFTSTYEIYLFLKVYLKRIYNFIIVKLISKGNSGVTYFAKGYYENDLTKTKKLIKVVKSKFSFFDGWSNYTCTYGNVL